MIAKQVRFDSAPLPSAFGPPFVVDEERAVVIGGFAVVDDVLDDGKDVDVA